MSPALIFTGMFFHQVHLVKVKGWNPEWYATAFVAFAVIRYGPARFRHDVVRGGRADWELGRGWDVLIAYVVPLLAAVLLVWWLYLAAAVYAPETWYDPFDPYSVMTCLVQLGLALGLLVALNRWMVRRTRIPVEDVAD